jgi:hypothetical protein
MSDHPTKQTTASDWEARHAAWVIETQRQLLILARKWGLA